MALLCSVVFHWLIYESLYCSTHNLQHFVAVAAASLTSAILVVVLVVDVVVVVHRVPILPILPIVSSCVGEESLESNHSSDSGYCRSRRG